RARPLLRWPQPPARHGCLRAGRSSGRTTDHAHGRLHASRRGGGCTRRSRRGRRGAPAPPADDRAGPPGRPARRDDAAEEHLLLPQAAVRAALPPAVIDIETCRAAVVDVKRVLAELPGRVDRELVLGIGEGGDETTAIDAAAEQVVVARLDAAGADFTLVSEELGIRPARGDSRTVVVVDPIDGSINAKRGIPFFSLSIAIADGPTMGDVHFGFVYDFGSGEEWVGYRGRGAQ